MSLLNKLLKRIGDKGLHFLCCFIYAYTVTLSVMGISRNYYAASFAGIASATGIAVGKEYGDKNAPGNHFCWKDIIADEAGAICGTALADLTYFLIALWIR